MSGDRRPITTEGLALSALASTGWVLEQAVAEMVWHGIRPEGWDAEAEMGARDEEFAPPANAQRATVTARDLMDAMRPVYPTTPTSRLRGEALLILESFGTLYRSAPRPAPSGVAVEAPEAPKRLTDGDLREWNDALDAEARTEAES